MEFAVLCLVALLIGVSKAGFGGGTGILVGPLLILFFPAKDSIGMMLPMLFACDVISLFPYWRKWDTRNVLMLLPGAIVGVVLGSLALNHMDDYWLTKTIGGLAVGFALLQVYRDWIVKTATALTPRWWLAIPVGFGTGFVSTLSHVGGILTTMYLIPQKMDAERFVGTTTALYFLVNLIKIPPYIYLDVLKPEGFIRDLPLFPIVLVGTLLGVWLNRRVPGQWFSRMVLVFVLLTGIWLLVK
jgi:uncharacterized membrane protein YfcA